MQINASDGDKDAASTVTGGKAKSVDVAGWLDGGRATCKLSSVPSKKEA